MKKFILIGFIIFFLLFSPAPLLFAQSDSVSGSSCETLGQVSQVCIGTRDYQILECKIAAGDNCQSLLDKKEKLAQSCDECIPTVYGGLIDTCEGKKKSGRTAAEFEVQCATPLRQLDEEYSKCRQTYAWKATGKGLCSVEGMVCSPQTSVGRRFDICRPGPDAYKVPDDTTTEAKKETSKQDEGLPAGKTEFVEFFNNLPFISVLNTDAVSETVTVSFYKPKDFGQAKTAIDEDIPQDIKELLEQFRPMTDEEFEKIWNSRPKDLQAGEDKIVDIGTGQSWKKGYWWGPDSGAVISPSSWEDIKFREPVKDNKTQEIKRMVELDQGEMEVRVRNDNPVVNKFTVDANGFFDLFVIQTHFWVNYDPDRKIGIVGVYEGEVEIKTKDGKTIKVKPDGDKPGVVVISQKLSPIKLALVGLILAGVIGGAIFFLKRKKKR